VLPRAPEQAVGEFKRAIRRAVKTLDSRKAEERHVAAVQERRVEKYPAEDGMAAIWALLPADGAEMFWAGLNRASAGLTRSSNSASRPSTIPACPGRCRASRR
jgi:hypothetical protein